MNIYREIHLLGVLILFTGLITVFVPATPAQDIHVLMVIDDGNPKTGQLHSINKDRMEGLMHTSVKLMLWKERPDATVNIDELLSNDDQVTRDNIFGWLRNVNPGADDVVFVYYSGGGGVDEENAKKRYLKMGELKLYREEVATIIESMQCRLKILITDTINIIGVLSEPMVHIMNEDVDIIDNLFLEHEGFLNLTSASLAHLSLGDQFDGGYFTVSLIDGILPGSFGYIDRSPQDAFVSWEEVFELTKEYLNEIYQRESVRFPQRLKDRLKQLNQTTQTPEVLSDFPKRIR